jgi:hypothetical protein
MLALAFSQVQVVVHYNGFPNIPDENREHRGQIDPFVFIPSNKGLDKNGKRYMRFLCSGSKVHWYLIEGSVAAATPNPRLASLASKHRSWCLTLLPVDCAPGNNYSAFGLSSHVTRYQKYRVDSLYRPLVV